MAITGGSVTGARCGPTVGMLICPDACGICTKKINRRNTAFIGALCRVGTVSTPLAPPQGYHQACYDNAIQLAKAEIWSHLREERA